MEGSNLCKTIVVLWCITKNIQEAMYMVKTFSVNDLKTIVDIKIDSETPPEVRAKKKAQEKAKKVIQKMSKGGTKKVIKKELSDKEINSIINGL